jgi:aminoglycoside 6-adenylyltransferase
VREPFTLLDDASWYERFGEVLAVEALPNPGWHPTRLVYYAGAKADFLVAPVDALGDRSYVRPFEVLIDKDGLASRLAVVAPQDHEPPDAATFSECLNWFYAAALMCAKCIVRHEPWMAKCRDWDLKCQLLRMIEWDHKARYGWTYETWFNGKHLTEWADPDVRSTLEECWSGFAVPDLAGTLLASFDLFDQLATRTAPAVGLAPSETSRVRNEMLSILQSRSLP